ncbi:hypothetical protein DW095_13945 [Bacteroides sp. AM07-16]|nr:hypothetical protein DW095_13945 [Bacteroides sp. AM07-16]
MYSTGCTCQNKVCYFYGVSSTLNSSH